MSSNELGDIITFYSYKGGTGRSMALSNVACILAESQSKGKRVLMIDWDLEAPGLHRYFHDKFNRQFESSNEPVKDFNRSPGLIDLFLELESLVPKVILDDDDDDEESEENANEILNSIDLEKFVIETDIPNLSLLKAGCFDEQYSTKVNTFNWEDLYNRSPYLFITFAEKLAMEYSYVLIDSRTGYTDTSGICTSLMPQKLVVVFTPNRQNYTGVSEIVRTATDYRRKSEDLRPLLVYPLPTRIESSRDDLRAEWRFGNSEKSIKGYQPMFEELLGEVYDIRDCNLDKYFEDVQIQHSPDYAYGEEIAVKVEKIGDRFSLSESYRVFAGWLLESSAPWQSLNDSNIHKFTTVPKFTSMHKFTTVEKSILAKYISDSKLSSSLVLIREVMERIWANDAPRIVQNYTDHGIEHSERIAYYVEKLLQVNPDAKFSEQEIYLLLAGIYLHDIGMQCDIIKYPEVKAKAENLGVNFDEAFIQVTTNGYSPEEQSEIRKNHHLLSAAWIDYLYEGNDPWLSPSIKSIPYDLVDDLIDVCKFHSKLPINDCPDSFKSDPNSRKKMVVALLRFADELDISSRRVDIGTVKIFSINSENSVYWWLHNYTKINFVNSNKVLLKVYLHPDDFESYGSFIRENYITNFKNKNQPILDVLVGQNIPLLFDNNSGVVVHNRAEKFPPEITAILDEWLISNFSSGSHSFRTHIQKNRGNLDEENVSFSSSQSMAYLQNKNSNIPYARNHYFTGREIILEQIHEALLSNKLAALSQPVAVCGLGGIGKTQVAIEYAYRYQDAYEFVLWVKAGSEDSIISDYVSIAKLLNLPVKDDSDQNLVISAVKNWLKTNDGWLLVLDNADSPYLIEDFLPSNPKGYILLTSRASYFDNLGIMRQVKIDKMLPEEARNFFVKLTGYKNLKSSELNALNELISELDGLPLAIEQAGAYIKKIKCSFEDYLLNYKKYGFHLLEKSSVVADSYPKSVSTTWLLNFERVKQNSKASAEILFVSAFLNPSRIPVEIFTKGSIELGPLVSSCFENVESDSLVLDEILEPLTQYSLIHRNTNNHTYDIHPLVQAVFRDRMDKDTQCFWAERTLKALNHIFPEVDFSDRQLCDRLLPHVQTCIEFIEEYGLEIEEFAKLLNSVGNYLYEHSRFEECELFYTRALEIREKVSSSEHPDVATYLNNLALLYKSQGRYFDAEPLFKRALAIRENVLGLEHPNVAASLNNLAKLYLSQGRYSDAETLYNRALAIREKTLGLDHPNLAESLNDLAVLYKSQGKYFDAEPLYTRALEINEKVFGSEHPEVATVLNNLALLYESLGRYFDAEPLFKRALTISEKILGSEHPDVANSLNNLAVLYVYQGRYSDAEPLYTRALEIRKKVLGSDHPNVASSLNNLAGLYYSQGKYSDAEPLYTRALEIREKVLGSDHSAVASSLNNLAALYDSQGKYSDAELLYTRALEIREKVLGSEHPEVATSLNNLAKLYKSQGRYSDAEPLYIRALAISEKVLGSEHPDVATYFNNLAELYNSQGRYFDAELIFKRVLDIRERALGSEHPDIANSLHNLATLYESQGRYSDAEPLYIRSLAISEKVLGSEHPAVASSLNNLAALYDSQGKYSDAEPLYTRALAIREKFLGSDHPDVATSLNNLAALYMSQGKNLKAKELFIRSINITEKSKGEAHPDLLNLLENYAYLLNKMKRGREASKILKRVEYIRAKNKKKY